MVQAGVEEEEEEEEEEEGLFKADAVKGVVLTHLQSPIDCK